MGSGGRLGTSGESLVEGRAPFLAAGILLVFGVFVFGSFYMRSTDVNDAAWASFWWGYAVVMLVLTIIITVWVAIGGVKNLREMFVTLENLERDDDDDGTVVGHRSLTDISHGVGNGKTA